MSRVQSLIDTLELRVKGLLVRLESLENEKSELSNRLADCKLNNIELGRQLQIWKEKHRTLEIANSLLGSKENAKETKLKINAMIRELDDCINHLSDWCDY